MAMAKVLSATPFDGRVIAGGHVTVALTVPADATMLLVAFHDRTGVSATNLDIQANGNPLTNLEGYTGEVPQFWYLVSPPVGAVTLDITDPTYQVIVEGCVYTLKDVYLANPFRPLVHTGGLPPSNTFVLTPESQIGDLVFDCVGLSTVVSDTFPMDPGSGQIEQFDRVNATQHVHRAAGSIANANEPMTQMTYHINNDPIECFALYTAVAVRGQVTGAPGTPTNVVSIARENYTIVKWDPPVDEPGAYRVYRSDLVNETDLQRAGTISTVDASGKLDTIFIDTRPGTTRTYRVVGVVGSEPGVVESQMSARSVAIFAPSQVDEKQERIDQLLLSWDGGSWDETLWA